MRNWIIQPTLYTRTATPSLHIHKDFLRLHPQERAQRLVISPLKSTAKIRKIIGLTKNILPVQKKFVLLQSEINRGIVQFRRPQFGDDLPSEPACDFFFLCSNGCNTVLYLLARPLDSHHHFDRSDAHQLTMHLLHLGEDFQIFHSFLWGFRLSEGD